MILPEVVDQGNCAIATTNHGAPSVAEERQRPKSTRRNSDSNLNMAPQHVTDVTKFTKPWSSVIRIE